jgi:hypothetical protein
MVENRVGWRELLGTIDDHQKVFNEQLMRLKADNMVPDPESPLLGPAIQYSGYVHIPICLTPSTEALTLQGARKARSTDHNGGLS